MFVWSRDAAPDYRGGGAIPVSDPDPDPRPSPGSGVGERRAGVELVWDWDWVGLELAGDGGEGQGAGLVSWAAGVTGWRDCREFGSTLSRGGSVGVVGGRAVREGRLPGKSGQGVPGVGVPRLSPGRWCSEGEGWSVRLLRLLEDSLEVWEFFLVLDWLVVHQLLDLCSDLIAQELLEVWYRFGQADGLLLHGA